MVLHMNTKSNLFRMSRNNRVSGRMNRYTCKETNITNNTRGEERYVNTRRDPRRIGRRSAVGIAPLSLLALGLMMAASTVRADNCYWRFRLDNDWFNPDNWYCVESGHSVPTSDDDVSIFSYSDDDVAIDGDVFTQECLDGAGDIAESFRPGKIIH